MKNFRVQFWFDSVLETKVIVASNSLEAIKSVISGNGITLDAVVKCEEIK